MYIYTVYVKWTKAAKAKGYEFFKEKWFPHHDQTCKKYGLKLIHWALPLGVTEDHVYLYESEIDVKAFMEFKGEASNFLGEALWEHSRTEIAVVPSD